MKLKVEETRLNGSRYYAVGMDFELASLEHRVQWFEIEDWCYKKFGERPMNEWPTAGDRWFANDRRFWFRDERDLSLFLMRWS